MVRNVNDGDKVSKTPYELRFDILELAKSTLESEYHSMTDQFRWEQETGLDKNRDKGDFPRYPNKDDIFKLADEFKQFIERK
jgi:hypothetical protein